MAITSTAGHGIEIGRRALQAHQVAINATGDNIANVNTPGYSRRQVNLEAGVSGTSDGIGAGADAVSLARQRSAFVDTQVRVQAQVLGRWSALEDSLQTIESLFNEPAGAGASEAGTVFDQPSGVGLSGSLSRFWNVWQDLANVPESGAARAAVREEGSSLAHMINRLHQQLEEAREGLDQRVSDTVAQINERLDELAELNRKIPARSSDDGSAANLQDRRDVILDELSQRIALSSVVHENGQISVFVHGHNILEGARAVHLATRRHVDRGLSVGEVVFADDRSAVHSREGALGGLGEARDGTIPELMDSLDEIASGLVQSVNGLHRRGYGRDGTTGIDFFAADGVTASSIALSEAVRADLNNIAASADGNPGDNSVALGISALRNGRIMAGKTETIEGYYQQLLGDVGARSQQAQTMAENHRLFAQRLENSRQSIQGVSLNDEAAQLIKYQRAYQAAARSVSIMDDLLQVVVNL